MTADGRRVVRPFVRSGAIGFLALVLLGGCLLSGPAVVPPDDLAKARLATTVREGLFLTNVRLDGREAGPFMIDTGSSALIIDTELARTLGPSTLWRDAGGFWMLRNLAVGPITLHRSPVRIENLSHVTDLGERLAGVLGYPFFQSAVVEVDYVRQSISCFEPSRYRLQRGAWEPLVLKSHRPGVTARLEGGAEGMFMLDTGSNHLASLFPHFLAKHPQVTIRDIRPVLEVGVGGEREVLMGRTAWFEVSGHRLERPWVAIEKPNAPRPSAARWFDGIVGEQALRQFVVVFNYPAGKIAFLPAEPIQEVVR